jgi:hypothetical protein
MKRIILLALSLLTINLMTGQTSLNATGGSVTNAGVTLSYSIGQVFYETNTISEGVQVPYNIMEITGVEDLGGIYLNIAVYPNPTSDYLELKFETKELDFKDVRYQIFDINGNQIKSDNLHSFQTNISMENTLKGVYIMEVKLNNKTVKTFKIVKN